MSQSHVFGRSAFIPSFFAYRVYRSKAPVTCIVQCFSDIMVVGRKSRMVVWACVRPDNASRCLPSCLWWSG